jgi:hypothetical protein
MSSINFFWIDFWKKDNNLQAMIRFHAKQDHIASRKHVELTGKRDDTKAFCFLAVATNSFWRCVTRQSNSRKDKVVNRKMERTTIM